MKKKCLIIVLIVINIVIIGFKSTLSSYFSTGSGKTKNLTFAKIVFNNKETSDLGLSLGNLNPSQVKEYTFQVSNYKDGAASETNIGYNISLETFHFIPTVIELYKKNEVTNDYEFVLSCDENSKRNEENKIVCTSREYSLNYKKNQNDDFLVKVIYQSTNFNQEPWSDEYANLTDFIDIKIHSWQIKEEN